MRADVRAIGSNSPQSESQRASDLLSEAAVGVISSKGSADDPKQKFASSDSDLALSGVNYFELGRIRAE